MNDTQQKAYAVLNPDDILTLRKYKSQEVQDKIRESGGTLENYISPYDVEIMRKNSNVQFPEHISEGDVLVRTSKDTYTIIRDKKNIQEILEHKVVAIQHIANLLGCISFKGANKITCVSDLGVNGNYSGSFSANIPIDNLPLSTNSSFSMNGRVLDSRQGIVDMYGEAVGILTKETYNEAILFAKECNLYDDMNIRTLIEERNPTKTHNVTTSRHYKIELLSDIIGGIELGYQLGVGIDSVIESKLNISADLKSEQHNKYYFEFDVSFPSKKPFRNKTIIGLITVGVISLIALILAFCVLVF